jgi:hypothetical protein
LDWNKSDLNIKVKPAFNMQHGNGQRLVLDAIFDVALINRDSTNLKFTSLQSSTLNFTLCPAGARLPPALRATDPLLLWSKEMLLRNI